MQIGFIYSINTILFIYMTDKLKISIYVNKK